MTDPFRNAVHVVIETLGRLITYNDVEITAYVTINSEVEKQTLLTTDAEIDVKRDDVPEVNAGDVVVIDDVEFTVGRIVSEDEFSYALEATKKI